MKKRRMRSRKRRRTRRRRVQEKVEEKEEEEDEEDCTSLTAHILAIEPMLLVMVTSVALARSSLLTSLRLSSLIMCPKLDTDHLITDKECLMHWTPPTKPKRTSS